MTSAPRSARWVVRLPGPSIDTSTMRKPASGAGRSAVTGPQATWRRSGVALEQAELIVGGVGHAALDRVGMTVKARVGHRNQRRANEGGRRWGARVDVRGDDLKPGHRPQRRVDRAAGVVALDPHELLDLVPQPDDLAPGHALAGRSLDLRLIGRLRVRGGSRQARPKPRMRALRG